MFLSQRQHPDLNLGRREKFMRLMEQYEPAIRRLINGYSSSKADQEDLFQEIVLAFWTALPRFRGQASERTWLYRIAHNVAITHMAKVRRKTSKEQHDNDSRFDPISNQTDPEKILMKQEKQQLLIESIRTLDPIDQQIIMLFLEGLSYAEMEEVTGLSQSNLGVRLTRARQKLGELLRRGQGR